MTDYKVKGFCVCLMKDTSVTEAINLRCVHLVLCVLHYMMTVCEVLLADDD